jgi:hypothetical protein
MELDGDALIAFSGGATGTGRYSDTDSVGGIGAAMNYASSAGFVAVKSTALTP